MSCRWPTLSQRYVGWRSAIGARQTAVGALVETLDQHFELGADDWYAQVKKELKARGVISTDRVIAEQEVLA